MANKKHAEDTASQNVLRAEDVPPTDRFTIATVTSKNSHDRTFHIYSPRGSSAHGKIPLWGLGRSLARLVINTAARKSSQHASACNLCAKCWISHRKSFNFSQNRSLWQRSAANVYAYLLPSPPGTLRSKYQKSPKPNCRATHMYASGSILRGSHGCKHCLGGA